MPSFEVLLMLGVLGFYLYDSGMLLYVNELMFLKEKCHWSFTYPGTNWWLLGKILYIPNPLAPDIAMFRVYWSESNQLKQDKEEEELEQYLSALFPFQYMVVSLLILFFAVLPFVLFWYGSGPQLLWLFGAIYIIIVAMLVQVYRKRNDLQVSNREFLYLSFESLTCAPFSINILRKLTLHYSQIGDPVEFARKVFDEDTFQRLIDVMSKKIEDQIELVDVGNPRYTALQSYKKRIEERKQ